MAPPVSGPAARGREERGLKRWVRQNGLTLALLGFFAASLFGQMVTGQRLLNNDLADHGQAPISFVGYLQSGHFIEAVFENWESEFLQMAAFVLFTVWLKQKGSPESNPLEGDDGESADERAPDAPWPVRRGGLVKAVYSHSLSIGLGLLFIGSFFVHALGGAREHNREQALHGKELVSFGEFLTTSEFWFESFQNWQSEFLAIASMVWLAVYLRQRYSPESKPVHAPHSETGR